MVLSRILGSGRHVAPQRRHPGPSRDGCSPGVARATACPPSVSASCAGLFSPPGMPLPDMALSLLPLEVFSALCCSHGARWGDGCREESSAAALQAARPPLGTPGLATAALSPQARCSLGAPASTAHPWIHPGRPPPPHAGPSCGGAQTLSRSHCSGRRIFLALWWFSLMLRLTDEVSRRTWKQNFHSPWRGPAVTHLWGLGGFARAQEEAEVSVEPLWDFGFAHPLPWGRRSLRS